MRDVDAISSTTKPKPKPGIVTWLTSTVGRILVSLLVPVITFLVLWRGFIFLRDSDAPQVVQVLVAIVWGVGGVALLYTVSNWLVEQLPKEWVRRIQPFVFVGPALAILAWYLVIPTFRTLFMSFQNDISTRFVGLDNFIFAFSDRIMLEAFRNNLLWMIFGTGFSVGLGLLIAVLADRTKAESIYKAIIFMPMAISFVGAGVIWGFVYHIDPDIGLLNAIITSLGGTRVAFLQTVGLNTILLIVVGIWIWTGFAMTILSAALKGVPSEILEAARVDGANEWTVFWQIIVPIIMPTITVVITVMIINVLKVFDIVYVMTGGNYGTEVMANRMYTEMYINFNTGRGTAIAVVLILVIVPFMWLNVKRFQEQEAIR